MRRSSNHCLIAIRRAWWAFAFMSVVWGGSYLLIKIAINGGMPAADVAWVRVAIAAVLLCAVSWREFGTLRKSWVWIVAYAVAVRSPAKPEFLRDLTSLTGGRLFEVEKTEKLDAIFVGILDEFRQRYLVSYTPRGVARVMRGRTRARRRWAGSR